MRTKNQICGSCDNDCINCRTALLLKNPVKKKRVLTDPKKVVKQCRKELDNILKCIWCGDLSDNEISVPIVGCTLTELNNHLYSTVSITNFEITQYDRTKYHVDHIIPFQKYVDGNCTIEEVTHYKNLRIISKDENFRKNLKY